MKFLLDENIDARLELYLRGQGHDGTVIGRHYPAGLGDQDVLHLAATKQRILLTETGILVSLFS